MIRRLRVVPNAKKWFDGEGLFLHQLPEKKGLVWRMAYRLDGKPQTITFGAYPLVTLAAARVKRDEVKRKLLDGANPSRRVDKRVVPTLRAVTAAYWGGRQDLSPKYIANATSAIERYILTQHGDVPVNQFTRDMMMDILNGMNGAQKFSYLRKLKMWFGQVLDYAEGQHHVDSNVTRAIVTKRAFGKRKVRHHPSVPLDRVGELLYRLSMERTLDSVIANELLARTWMRTGELRWAKWSDISASPGLSVRRLVIPAARMKKDADLVVPLTRQVEALLATAKLRCRGSEYICPSYNRVDRPISENTILELLDRIGYKGQMTGHGWRTVASTWANEAGYRDDAIERQLAHKPEDDTRAVYNRAEYLSERAGMLQAWSDWLDQQLGDVVARSNERAALPGLPFAGGLEIEGR